MGREFQNEVTDRRALLVTVLLDSPTPLQRILMRDQGGGKASN